MTAPTERAAQSGQVFVVAIEYAGSDVPAGIGGSRRPLLEHAYEVRSGLMLAHPDLPPRVAFPDPERGWPATPHLARCVGCTATVTELVRQLITDLVAATVGRVSMWFANLTRGLLLTCLMASRLMAAR